MKINLVNPLVKYKERIVKVAMQKWRKFCLNIYLRVDTLELRLKILLSFVFSCTRIVSFWKTFHPQLEISMLLLFDLLQRCLVILNGCREDIQLNIQIFLPFQMAFKVDSIIYWSHDDLGVTKMSNIKTFNSFKKTCIINVLLLYSKNQPA